MAEAQWRGGRPVPPSQGFQSVSLMCVRCLQLTHSAQEREWAVSPGGHLAWRHVTCPDRAMGGETRP